MVLTLTFAPVAMAQELKKEFIDQQAQESRSAAVKVKGGAMLFLAGHTASQPRPDADLGNFDTQFKAVFDKIANTVAKAGGNLDDIVSMSVFLTDLRYAPQSNCGFTVTLLKRFFEKGKEIGSIPHILEA